MTDQVARTDGERPPARKPDPARRTVGAIGAVAFLSLAVLLQRTPELLPDVPRWAGWGLAVVGALVSALDRVFFARVTEWLFGGGPGSGGSGSGAVPPPAELPPYSNRFTGHDLLMAELRSRFDRFPRSGVRRLLPRRPRASGDEQDRAPLVIAVTGAAGTGKTQLVTQIAYEVADRFPDGQRWVELYGDSEQDDVEELEPSDVETGGPSRAWWPWPPWPRRDAEDHDPDDPVTGLALAAARHAPRRTEKVLVDLLRSLGGNPRTDAPLRELTVAWRSLTNTKRLLIVLDNAKDAGQVAALLPNGARCAVLITSRRSFSDASFECETREIGGLTPDEGLELLRKLAPDRLGVELDEGETETARAIVARCHGLPLALRLCGGRLAAASGPTPAELLRELGNPARTPLLHAPNGFAASFAVTFHECRARERLLLKRVADSGLVDFTDWSAAALLDVSTDVAGALLGELHHRFLVVPTGGDDPEARRYRMHDLVRDTLRGTGPAQLDLGLDEQARWTEDERTAAARRLLTAYTWLAERAADTIGRIDDAFERPETTTLEPSGLLRLRPPRRPDRWLARERRSLLTCFELAERHEFAEMGWRVTRAFASMCQSRRVFWADWEESTRAQVRMAYARGDRLSVGMALLDRAEFTGNQGDYERGAEYALTAQTILEQMPQPYPLWKARAQRAIGVNLHRRGDLDDGLLELAEAERVFAANGAHWWRARTLTNMAELHSFIGDQERAQVLLDEACAMFRTLADWEQYHKSRVMLAEVLAIRGRVLNAWYVLNEAHERFEAASEHWYVARCLRAMAELDGDELWLQYKKCDDALAPTRRVRAWRLLRTRLPGEESGAIGPARHMRVQEARILLGEYWDLRELEFGPYSGPRRTRRRGVEQEWSRERRIAMLRQAIDILRGMGDGWGVSRTRLSLGRILIGFGEVNEGAETMRAAAEGFAELGDQWWHARSHRLTAEYLHDAEHSDEALEHARLAYESYRRMSNHVALIRVHTLLGRILYVRKDLKGAERHWREAIAAARAHGEDSRSLDAHERLRRLLGDDWETAPAAAQGTAPASGPARPAGRGPAAGAEPTSGPAREPDGETGAESGPRHADAESDPEPR